MSFLKEFVYRIRGEYTTEKLKKRGMRVGSGFSRLNGVILDPDHCWLIKIGDNVTLAPRVHVLCHDASTKRFLGYTKVGKVTIGNNVFVGAGSIILPNTTIGDNVIIGANSTVTHNIPNNSVAAGNPAKVYCSLEEYLNKERKRLGEGPVYGHEYTLSLISENQKQQQINELTEKIGFIE